MLKRNDRVSFNCARDASLTINDHPSGSSTNTRKHTNTHTLTMIRECTVRKHQPIFLISQQLKVQKEKKSKTYTTQTRKPK